MTEVQQAETAPAAVVNETPATPDDTMSAVYDKFYPTERVDRGEGGKFVSKNPAEGAEVAEPAKQVSQEPAVETKEPARPAIPRPQSWSSDLDEWWSTLPPERQEFLAKRDGDAHKRISELGETAKTAEQFKSLIDRYKHVLNGPPDQEIQSLLATKEALLRNPEQSIQWLAQQLKVDLSKFAQPQGEQSAETDQLRPLMQKIAQLERQLGETHNKLTAREQQDMQSREQSLASLVDDFKKDKDYWGDIEGEVLNQIVAIKAASPSKDPKVILQEAHDRALKLNDEVSNKLTKAKRDKEAAEKAAEEKRKADEAKRLASLNAKSSSGTPKSAKNIDAEMNEAYDRIMARA